MTIIFAFAQPLFAIIAADTRALVLTRDTDTYNDSEALRIRYQDGTIVSYPARGRKLRRFAGGWAVGTGDFFLVDACLSRLSKSHARTPISINTLLQETYHVAVQEKQQVLPNAPPDELTIINYVYKVSNQFKLGSITLAGDV